MAIARRRRTLAPDGAGKKAMDVEVGDAACASSRVTVRR